MILLLTRITVVDKVSLVSCRDEFCRNNCSVANAIDGLVQESVKLCTNAIIMFHHCDDLM